MKHKQKLVSGLLSVWLALTAFPLSALASGYYGSDESGNTIPPASIDSITISTEDVAIEKDSAMTEIEDDEVDLDSFFDDLYSVFGGTSALTPVGNMTLVDDILQDESNTSVHKLENEQKSKQFITIQTKNGNYFYLIIDRSGDTENVYFLNMVDESDLLALMADGTEEETEKPEPVCVCEEKCITGEVNMDCEVCVLTMKKCGGKEIVVAEPVPEPEEPKNSSGILLIVLLLAAGGGAVYFLKFRKNKPDTSGTTDLDDYDYGEEDEEIEYENETEDND